MWKKLKSRGAETVEYAIVLACIAAFGLMFSDNLTHTLETLMGKTGSIITNGSTDKGDKDDDAGKDDKEDKEDEKDKLEQETENKNLAWIKNLFAASEEKDPKKGFGNYLDNSIKTRKDLNFTNNDGLIDSGSNSVFVNRIEGILNTNGTIPGSSWAFSGYTDKDGQKYYNVSIYTPEKNGGKSLADLQAGASIKTDVYKVNAKTGDVEKMTNYANQIVAVRTDKGKSYNIIRDNGYK
ncbi:hypothetical protein [Phascolarctobacterium sp.]|uniref:hypothetical protein n=1 Tax=Phascolarctobacterium sp. TaxID=2049039 RepID=UPI003F80869F